VSTLYNAKRVFTWVYNFPHEAKFYMGLQLSTRDHIGYVRGDAISAIAIILSLYLLDIEQE